VKQSNPKNINLFSLDCHGLLGCSPLTELRGGKAPSQSRFKPTMALICKIAKGIFDSKKGGNCRLFYL